MSLLNEINMSLEEAKMRRSLLKGCICWIIAVGVVAASWAGEQGKTDILDKLIQDGKWAEAQEAAKALRTADTTSAIPAYVVDIASDIVDDMAGQLFQYQFPYSDKRALPEIQAWTEALMKKIPRNPNVLLASAMVYSPKALSNSSKFVDLLEQAKAASPNNAFILESLGSGYGAQGKYDQAVTTLQRAIQINPKSSGAWTNLGVAYLKKGNTDEAVRAFKKAIEANSLDGTALFNLGSYYAERNMNEQAQPFLEKAIQRNPQLMEARWNLGGVYFKSGQREKAIQQLKEMIKIAPDSPMGQRAKQMLSQLGG
jgi:tetratricopeptide (TPR) repeat protein